MLTSAGIIFLLYFLSENFETIQLNHKYCIVELFREDRF